MSHTNCTRNWRCFEFTMWSIKNVPRLNWRNMTDLDVCELYNVQWEEMSDARGRGFFPMLLQIGCIFVPWLTSLGGDVISIRITIITIVVIYDSVYFGTMVALSSTRLDAIANCADLMLHLLDHQVNVITKRCVITIAKWSAIVKSAMRCTETTMISLWIILLGWDSP